MENILNMLNEKKERKIYKKEEIECFNLPIEYLDNLKEISNSMKEELNLIDNKEENIQGLYNKVFNIEKEKSKIIINKLLKYYTNNKEFIKDSQKYYKNLDISLNEIIELDEWLDFKNQQEFLKKYQYIEWEKFNNLNQNPIFLQLMTIYNLTSPLIQLSLPFIFLLVPFIIIKFSMKVPLTLEMYKKILLKQLQGHQFGKLFNNLTDPNNMDKKITAAVTLAFYLFSIYQNGLLCYKFYKNIFIIKEKLYKIKCEFMNGLLIINNLREFIKNNELNSYIKFNNDLESKEKNIENVLKILDFIKDKSFNVRSILDVGKIMGIFHKLYYDDDIHKLMCYIKGLYGYIDICNEIKENIKVKKINNCTFGKETKLKEMKYPFGIDNLVVNNYNSKSNYIITGPNASGKTTYIKTILINILLSQQLGYGFYKEGTINVYDGLYSYINIPDNCGRDSLFQAEARRCLEIIKEIDTKGNYLCIFDELFSGTNPKEATLAGKALLRYLNNNKVNLLLTTHYHGICSLEKMKNMNFKNYHLGSKEKYKLERGLSKEKGGIKVLYDLDYPKEILDMLNL